MIFLHGDYDEIEKELDRVGGMPTVAMREKLDAVLATGFKLTQAAVHVETGALKASGTSSSEVDHLTASWEGSIVYGTEDGGPVDYAIYEQARGVHWVGKSNVKGDHDFMRPLEALGVEYKAALLEGLSHHD